MTPHAPDEWMRRFGTLPLMHQPGERWMYNTGSLLQGVLVRRASGQAFDVFVQERILAPPLALLLAQATVREDARRRGLGEGDGADQCRPRCRSLSGLRMT